MATSTVRASNATGINMLFNNMLTWGGGTASVTVTANTIVLVFAMTITSSATPKTFGGCFAMCSSIYDASGGVLKIYDTLNGGVSIESTYADAKDTITITNNTNYTVKANIVAFEL